MGKNIKQQLEDFAKWFNENQWRGGKGDYNKNLFCKCDYEGIVKLYLSEQKPKKP